MRYSVTIVKLDSDGVPGFPVSLPVLDELHPLFHAQVMDEIEISEDLINFKASGEVRSRKLRFERFGTRTYASLTLYIQ